MTINRTVILDISIFLNTVPQNQDLFPSSGVKEEGFLLTWVC
jgi:hypothetical protein